MKTLTLALAFLCLNSFAFAARTANLQTPEWVFNELREQFPEFVYHIGGNSYEITLKELNCAVSNVEISGKTSVTAECIATNDDDRSKTIKASFQLFAVLLNSGAKIDRKSEAGTTYISLKNLDCGVIDPNTNPHGAEYSCSFKK